MLKTPNQKYQNCLRIIESIEEGSFDIGSWCYCIRGHALKVAGVDKYVDDPIAVASEFMGLPIGNAIKMFGSNNYPGEPNDPAPAIARIRQHMATLTD